MTIQKLDNDIKVLKSKASLFDHCCITVPSLSHHCLITVFVKRSYVTKHTPKALQMDKIWSLTSQNLENDVIKLKSKASLFHHCHITVPSLSHHCLITVWSLFFKHTPKALQQDTIRSITSQNRANDIKEPKSKGITFASLFHHCLITVFVKRSCVTKGCIITLQNMIIDISKAWKWNQRHHCCITVPSLFHHCFITVWSLFLSNGLVSPADE
jgi:hypothetical protein